jgi:hypothetical protein
MYALFLSYACGSAQARSLETTADSRGQGEVFYASLRVVLVFGIVGRMKNLLAGVR